MRGQSKCPIQLDRPNIVGTIHSAGGFAAARRAKRLGLNAAEIRVDCLKHTPSPKMLAALALPVLLTVRRADEGGARPMPEALRKSLYLSLLPAAAAIDLELRSTKALKPVLSEARRLGKPVIVSFHDFAGTPKAGRLRDLVRRARGLGADVVKIATTTHSASDAARLVDLLDLLEGGPLAVMGMGAWGRALRILMLQQGSSLNYGWLHRPQVPGQWSAGRLCRFRNVLAEK